MRIRRPVVFPEPFGPRSATTFPFSTSSDKPFRARTRPKDLWTCFSSITITIELYLQKFNTHRS